MNRCGLTFIKEQFKTNPSISFIKLKETYNEEAMKRGWRKIKSAGTIAYHLSVMGMYTPCSRNYVHDTVCEMRKAGVRREIELNAKGKAALAKTFGVTVQSISLALLFRRNSAQACKIREAALKNGGSLVQMIDVTDELKRAIKVLDSKGNVKEVITL